MQGLVPRKKLTLKAGKSSIYQNNVKLKLAIEVTYFRSDEFQLYYNFCYTFDLFGFHEISTICKYDPFGNIKEVEYIFIPI